MQLIKIPIGAGMNADVDSTSVEDNAAVSLINCYQDRGKAIRDVPGLIEYATLDTAADEVKVWPYYSKLHAMLLVVVNGRIWRQIAKDGAWVEITGAELDATAVPAWTENGTHVFVAANSPIYKIAPDSAIATTIGNIVEEEEDTTPIGVAITTPDVFPNPRVVSLISDGAASIYYTTDGSTPDSSATLYTGKIAITTTTTLKAIAYDGDGVASAVASELFTVSPPAVAATRIALVVFGAVDKNTLEVTSFSVVDSTNVTGYCITESATPPLLNDPKWTTAIPTKYISRSAAAGSRTVYPWVRNKEGYISDITTNNHTAAFLDADIVPNAFSFADQTDTRRSRYIESEAIQPQDVTFTVSVSITGGEYAISTNGGGAWTNWRTANGTMEPTDQIKVRHLSSAENDTATTTTLTIGGVSGTFTSRTAVLQVPRSITHLAYMGGYLLAKGVPSTGESVPGDIMYSDDVLNDYFTWEVYNNESNADAVQAMIPAYEQIYNIGTQTVEVSLIDGVTPFAVNKNAFQQHGTMARNGAVFDGESIYFPSEAAGIRCVIKLVNGSSPKIISQQINSILADVERLDNAVGYTLGFRGQNFYALDIPTANVTVDDNVYESLTLAYHLQTEEWVIFAKWNEDEGIFSSYRGTSYCFVEPWGLALIGGRDGKLYQFYDDTTIDYLSTPVLRHRWRNNHNEKWRLPRTIKLYAVGERRLPPDQNQCGRYKTRQHEFIYTDQTDAGETKRVLIKTGYISHGTGSEKIAAYYRYNLRRGENGLVFNHFSEGVETTGR